MKILIIDIETTGLTISDKIIEIGMVSLDLETGAKEIEYDSLVYEQGMTELELRNSWIIKNGWMDPEEVLQAPSMAMVKPYAQYIIDQYPDGATAFNRKFDFDFLHSRGIRIPVKLPCPMLLATNVCKLPGKYGDYKWPKVEEAYAHLYPDREYKEIHRGADDAMHEADIVLALYRMGIFKPEDKVA